MMDLSPEVLSDSSTFSKIILDYPNVVYSILVLYVLFVKWIVPAFMKNRKPYNLQGILVGYNLLQAVANLHVAYLALHGGLTYWAERCNMRSSPRYQEIIEVAIPTALKLCAIKFLDLLDTVFFVLRKKQTHVSFLHVFHHAGMALMFYWGLKNIEKIFGYHLIFGFFLNTVVHVIMYTYYGLAAMGPHMQKYLWWKKHLTRLQIGQIFIILIFFTYAFLTRCENFGNYEIQALVYLFITFVLFLNFYRKYKKNR